MFALFLIVILGIILWPAIKAGYKVWSNMRSMQRFMQDPVGEMERRAREDARRQQRQNRREEREASRRAAADPNIYAQGTTLRKKKIPGDVGEYVSFTEVDAVEVNSCDVPPVTVTEQQVVDIEWEDIK